jgi:site-specific recombinase XerD
MLIVKQPSQPSERQLPAEIRSFLDDLARQERSPHTRAAYESDLQHFARWFLVSNGEEFSAAGVTPTDVRGYRSHLQAVQGRKPATINRRLAALRTFYRWAMGTGLVAGDPTRAVETVRTTTTAPRSLPRADLNRLTREAQRDAQAARGDGKRNLAVIQTLRYTGIRVGELVVLVREDLVITERGGQLTVRSGKGGKFRQVPLNAEARRALREYLDVRPAAATDRVFVGQRGPLTENAVRRIVDKYARRAGLEDVTPHTLRHSFGRHALDAGVDLVTVATLLGHEDLKTTAIYTRPSQEDLVWAVDRLEVG